MPLVTVILNSNFAILKKPKIVFKNKTLKTLIRHKLVYLINHVLVMQINFDHSKAENVFMMQNKLLSAF